jgi:hypothetical protein
VAVARQVKMNKLEKEGRLLGQVPDAMLARASAPQERRTRRAPDRLRFG